MRKKGERRMPSDIPESPMTRFELGRYDNGPADIEEKPSRNSSSRNSSLAKPSVESVPRKIWPVFRRRDSRDLSEGRRIAMAFFLSLVMR